MTGTGPFAFDVYRDFWIRRVVDMSNQRFRDHRHVPVFFVHRARNFPCHLGKIRWCSAIDFAVKKLDDFRPALGPPHLRRRHWLAVIQQQRIGGFGIDVRLCLVVIRGVGRIGVALGAGAQFRDAERVHLPLMLLF